MWTPKCVGCAQGAYDSYIPEMRLVFEFEKGGSTAAIGIGDDGLFKRGDQRRKWATTACDGGEVGGKVGGGVGMRLAVKLAAVTLARR